MIILEKLKAKPKGLAFNGKKDDQSTFFPDSWGEEKIKEEIAWTYGNMKPKVYKGKTYY